MADGADRPPSDIVERAALFADRCIRAAQALPDNGVAWELQRQLVRSSGSVGANLAERKGVLSKPEFNHKVSVSLREAHETLYWLDRINNAELLPRQRLQPLMDEGNEIVSILTATLKKGRDQS
ncbi:MAG: four helix bundle protein [bacterium]|nr:four helix bundle protein [bacterium]